MSEKLSISIVLIITLLCFLPALNAGFIETWDDAPNLTANTAVHSLSVDSIKTIFTTPINKTYIPLTLLSFALEHAFFGLNPFIYHLNNILLHLAITGLIFLFVRRIGLPGSTAGLAALIFGIHPIHVESVAWITERKDVLYAFFYMLALCAYVKYLKTNDKKSYRLTVVFGMLSILSKPMALSLPLIFFLLDWLLERPFGWNSIKDKIPHFLYIIPVTWITYALFMRVPIKYVSDALLIWIWSFVFYLRSFVFPVGLLPHYQLPEPISVFHPQYIMSLVLVIMFFYLIVRFRKNRLFCFAFIFYFFSIFFLLRYDNTLDFGNLSIVADRFMYLPSLGFCILFGHLISSFLKAARRHTSIFRYTLFSATILLFIILSVQSYRQTLIWKNDFTLWSYNIQRSPTDQLGYVNRARFYKNNLQHAEALLDLNTAIHTSKNAYIPATDHPSDQINATLANNPYYVLALSQRVDIYILQNRHPEAINDLNRLLEIKPTDRKLRSLRTKIYKALEN